MKKDGFRKLVLNYYKKHGRELPWRKKSVTPYQILVSEVMLQQTQVDRVIPKYTAFIRDFPNFKQLAEATLKDVLTAWQGLGYNRRARNLKHAAEIVTKQYQRQLPKDKEKLLELPGIGEYTASAIRVFAHNIPDILLETNIRSVLIAHFADLRGLKRESTRMIHDKELLPLIEQTLDHKNPRDWYAALMDYGSRLKKIHPNPSRQSAHHTKQSRFEGSHRQIRGLVLKKLTEKSWTPKLLAAHLQKPPKNIREVLKELSDEGFIEKKLSRYHLV